jgi:hypothetical protein
MSDWADKIESEIAAAYSSHGQILAGDGDGMISRALRKAKADGMREIALSVSVQIDYLTDFAEGLKYCARRIEKRNE